jgi:hypothetical protein
VKGLHEFRFPFMHDRLWIHVLPEANQEREPGGIKELKDYACSGTNLRKIE